LMYIYDESADALTTRTSNSAVSVGLHFIVVTYDGTGGASAGNGMTMYVDGVAVASSAGNNGSYVAMENLSASVFVGAFTGTGGTPADFMTGDFGLQFITQEELSSTDVWEMYLATRGLYNV